MTEAYHESTAIIDLPDTVQAELRREIHRLRPTRAGLTAGHFRRLTIGRECPTSVELTALAATADCSADERELLAHTLLSATCSRCGRQHQRDGIEWVEVPVDHGRAIEAAGWAPDGRRRAVVVWDERAAEGAGDIELLMAGFYAWHGACRECSPTILATRQIHETAAGTHHLAVHQAGCPMAAITSGIGVGK